MTGGGGGVPVDPELVLVGVGGAHQSGGVGHRVELGVQFQATRRQRRVHEGCGIEHLARFSCSGNSSDPDYDDGVSASLRFPDSPFHLECLKTL